MLPPPLSVAVQHLSKEKMDQLTGKGQAIKKPMLAKMFIVGMDDELGSVVVCPVIFPAAPRFPSG